MVYRQQISCSCSLSALYLQHNTAFYLLVVGPSLCLILLVTVLVYRRCLYIDIIPCYSITEIATSRWYNTCQVIQNVFVLYGQLIIVTEYHKARTRTNSSYYVVQVVIARVARGQQEGLQYSRDNSVTQTTML
jgi:hypothetical protein